MILSLYDFPQLYDRLLMPDPALKLAVSTWLGKHLQGPLAAVMDPACGSGAWLMIFARQGLAVAGNDRLSGMVQLARRQLAPYPSELICGDMQDLPFRSRPFDVALNLESSVGHLPDLPAVVRHLQAVARNLRPGGLYLLGVTLHQGCCLDTEVQALYQQQAVFVPPAGTASVRYASLWRDPERGQERIRVEVTTRQVPGCPATLTEEYDLLIFSAAEVHQVLAQSGSWRLLAAYDMAADGFPDLGLDREGCHGITLVLRRA